MAHFELLMTSHLWLNCEFWTSLCQSRKFREIRIMRYWWSPSRPGAGSWTKWKEITHLLKKKKVNTINLFWVHQLVGQLSLNWSQALVEVSHRPKRKAKILFEQKNDGTSRDKKWKVVVCNSTLPICVLFCGSLSADLMPVFAYHFTTWAADRYYRSVIDNNHKFVACFYES